MTITALKALLPPPPPTASISCAQVWSAWLWATLVCLGIYHSRACVVDWGGPLRRWMRATVWWILVTLWFLRPSFIDPAFRTTGGEWWDCAGPSIPTSKSPFQFSDRQYVGEHDMSGHVFILTHASILIYSMNRGCRPVGWGHVAAMGPIGLWWCILLKGLYLHPHLEEVNKDQQQPIIRVSLTPFR
ncbi:hypothetical protein HOY82DRAFT_494875 [Tuber indicum]|nr:hypothetical protein HOY82DRAFT_494875 [Tuber indicum]